MASRPPPNTPDVTKRVATASPTASPTARTASRIPVGSSRRDWLRRGRDVAATITLLGSGVATSSGCRRATPAAPATRVFATTALLADLVRRVGGAAVRIDWAAEAGRPLQPGRPSERWLTAARSAQLVVGGPDAPWATAGFDDPFQAVRFVRTDLIAASGLAGAEAWEPDARRELHPDLADAIVEAISRRLSALRPSLAGRFAANARSFFQESAGVRARAAVLRDVTGTQGVGGTHLLRASDEALPLLAYLGRRSTRVVQDASGIGVGQRGGPNASGGGWWPIRPEPGIARRLRDAARDAGAGGIVLPDDVPPAAVASLARRSGLRPILLDLLGGAPRRGGWLDVMAFNLRQLAEPAGESIDA